MPRLWKNGFDVSMVPLAVNVWNEPVGDGIGAVSDELVACDKTPVGSSAVATQPEARRRRPSAP